jgi:hypothetical protein
VGLALFAIAIALHLGRVKARMAPA